MNSSDRHECGNGVTTVLTVAGVGDLMASHFGQGGQVLLCTPCVKGRNIAPETLVGNASLVAAGRVFQECLEAKAVLNY